MSERLWVRLRVALAMAAGLLILSACSNGANGPTPQAPTLTKVEQQGALVFAQHCSRCHATSPGAIVVGPSLSGIARTAELRVDGMDAATYIRSSILTPNAYIVEGFNNLMPPTFGATLSADQLDAVVAYLLTLQ